MGQLIKTNGEIEEVKPINGIYFSLEEMQTMVGGWIEIFLVKNKSWVVNEEGLLLDLPVNLKATEMLKSMYRNAQILVGNVLITDQSEIR